LYTRIHHTAPDPYNDVNDDNYQMAPPQRADSSAAATTTSSVVCFTIHAESFRIFAYLSFWGMVILAIVCTKYLVEPNLGFDLETESDIKKYFGFNNVSMVEFG
jgi:hypothetical protein